MLEVAMLSDTAEPKNNSINYDLKAINILALSTTLFRLSFLFKCC